MTNDKTHKETYEDGLAIRREVLGTEHVNRSLEQSSEFARPIQELVTEYCWGTVWSREGLDKKTRSMINIAMLTAMNRSHELSVHIKGALHNGVTESEIQEILLQCAIYVGVPAALESFRITENAINESKKNAE
jgi:4-carboxymuconolactone decarboxylase